MDNEQAKTILNLLASYMLRKLRDVNCKDISIRKFCEEYVDALVRAIEALEKQIPKKPRVESEDYYGYTEYFCPNCSTFITEDCVVGNGCKYCDECGQKILWEENE